MPYSRLGILCFLIRYISIFSTTSPGRVDIVLDNAGFEFITDLCLAEFVIAAGLAKTVHLHAKAFPWFVSDVTPRDFESTKEYFQCSNSLAMNMLCKKWNERITEGSWTFQVHDYWTMPQDYSDMKKYCPDLYADLSTSSLIIFKGDLNYRKLVGDRDWPTTTPFEQSLRKFHPAPLCALRTLKADLVTGLKEGQADKVEKKDKNWMVNGNWAVISYCGTVHRWAATWQNQQSECAQQRLRSAWAFAQSDQSLRCVLNG